MKNYLLSQLARIISLGSHDYFFGIFIVFWFLSDISQPKEYRFSSFVLVFAGSLAFVSLIRHFKTKSVVNKVKDSIPFLIIFTIFCYQKEIIAYLSK